MSSPAQGNKKLNQKGDFIMTTHNEIMKALKEAAKKAAYWGVPFVVAKWKNDPILCGKLTISSADVYDCKYMDLIAIVFSNGNYQTAYPNTEVKNIAI